MRDLKYLYFFKVWIQVYSQKAVCGSGILSACYVIQTFSFSCSFRGHHSRLSVSISPYPSILCNTNLLHCIHKPSLWLFFFPVAASVFLVQYVHHPSSADIYLSLSNLVCKLLNLSCPFAVFNYNLVYFCHLQWKS